jgi:hypothetical protein
VSAADEGGTAWENPAVRWVLGGRLHPGGPGLTRLLAGEMGLGAADRVVDLGCGEGETAALLAAEHRCVVIGLDVGAKHVSAARSRAEREGVSDRVRIVAADAAGRLPVGDGAATALVAECVVSALPDPAHALREAVRVVGPGGRVGLTDLVVDPDRLAAGERDLIGRLDAFARAPSEDGWRAHLARAGLELRAWERHDEALAATVAGVQARLRPGASAARFLPAKARKPVEQGLAYAAAAERAVAAGGLGYALMVADRV